MDNHLLVTNLISGEILLSTKSPLPPGEGIVEAITAPAAGSKWAHRLCIVSVSEGKTSIRAFSSNFHELETAAEGLDIGILATGDGRLVLTPGEDQAVSIGDLN